MPHFGDQYRLVVEVHFEEASLVHEIHEKEQFKYATRQADH
jgi:hypothetical protein